MHAKYLRLLWLAILFQIAAHSVLMAEIAVSVSPMRLEYAFSRDNVINDTVIVANTGNESLRVKVLIRDWNLSPDGTPVFLSDPGSPYSCSPWITINPVDFRIGPEQTRTIRFSIRVPESAADQGYRSALVFEFIPDVKPGQGKKIQVKSQIVTVIYGAAGNPPVQGEVTGFSAVVQKEQVQFVIKLKNSGRIHFRTKGKLKIKDAGGRVIMEHDLPDVPALPESERVVVFSIPKKFPKGNYTALALVDIGAREITGMETRFAID